MDFVAPLSWKKWLMLGLGVEPLKAVAEHQYVPPLAAVVFNARMSIERLAETADAESVVECQLGQECEGLSSVWSMEVM
jgi:hypothetical protein